MDQFLKELLGHLRGMWNRRLIGLAVAWAVAIIGFALAFAVPEKYEASARVQVDTQTLLKPVLEGLSIQPNLDQQVALISRTLLNRGNIEKLMQMSNLDAAIDSNAMREEVIDRLTRTIQITGNANSNLYVITYRDSNPQQAQNIVSSLLKIFFESSAGGKRQDSRSALKFLDEEIARYEQSLQIGGKSPEEFPAQVHGRTRAGRSGQSGLLRENFPIGRRHRQCQARAARGRRIEGRLQARVDRADIGAGRRAIDRRSRERPGDRRADRLAEDQARRTAAQLHR